MPSQGLSSTGREREGETAAGATQVGLLPRVGSNNRPTDIPTFQGFEYDHRLYISFIR